LRSQTGFRQAPQKKLLNDPLIARAGQKACGRFTVKTTWAEIVALYRLTLDRPPHNLQPRYNVCPTDPIDVVIERDGKRGFVRVDQDEGNTTGEISGVAA
jgi:hypothetical protein